MKKERKLCYASISFWGSTAQGLAGAMQDGFATREQTMYKIANSVGAKIISAGFDVGEYDLIVVVEADEAQSAAVALKVNPSGAVSLSVIPIMSAADMDMSRAVAMGAEWQAPGTNGS